MKKPKGGARPGAGMPAGHVTQKTLDKLAARELVRETVTRALGPLIAAQIANATGIDHFFLRDEKGQWTRLEDPDQIQAALNLGTGYRIFTKDPSVQAFSDLLNRALDKPKEQEMAIKVDRGPSGLSDDELRALILALGKKL